MYKALNNSRSRSTVSAPDDEKEAIGLMSLQQRLTSLEIEVHDIKDSINHLRLNDVNESKQQEGGLKHRVEQLQQQIDALSKNIGVKVSDYPDDMSGADKVTKWLQETVKLSQYVNVFLDE